jgi:hypothetical protein
MDQESLKQLMDSVTEKGVLQPVLVYQAPEEGPYKYVLVAGERRYLASKALNRPHIPARILTKEPVGPEIIEIQLIENLHRKDLNPIDEALGYLRYYSTCLKCSDLELDAMSNDLFTYTTRPEKLKRDVALIINALEKISGKSISYIRKLVTLLRLPEEAISAVRSEALGLTRAIVFSENLNSSRFKHVLSRASSNKMTVKAIQAAFKRGTPKNSNVALYKRRISQLSNDIETNISMISTEFAEQILLEADELIKIIKSVNKK